MTNAPYNLLGIPIFFGILLVLMWFVMKDKKPKPIKRRYK